MTYSLPPLQWLRAFEAAARHLSFTAAARELNLTQTAISQQIRSLERRLGFPLFVRMARSLRLTDMGAAWLPSVRRAFDELAVSTAGLFGQDGMTTLTVRAPVSFAVTWIAPRLPAFRRAWPHIGIRLFSAIWADALAQDRADIDIRFGTGAWPGFEAELLRRDGAVMVCHRAVGRGAPDEALARILAGPLIHVMGVEDMWERLRRDARLGDAPAPSGEIWVDTSLAALELVAAGMGSAIVLRPFAEHAMQHRPIWSPLDIELPLDQAHYLLAGGPRREARPEALLFRDWLMEQARR